MAGSWSATWADSWGASWGYSGGSSPSISATVSSGAGRSKHRRYILPDGSEFTGTMQEVTQLLRRYSVPIERPEPRKKSKKRIVKVPRLEFRDEEIRMLLAADSLPNTYQAVLPRGFTYRPPLTLEKPVNRLRRDDEAIIALLLGSP